MLPIDLGQVPFLLIILLKFFFVDFMEFYSCCFDNENISPFDDVQGNIFLNLHKKAWPIKIDDNHLICNNFLLKIKIQHISFDCRKKEFEY